MTGIQILAIVVIFLVGGGGAILPLLMRTRVSPSVLSRGNAFAGGVLLAAGLIHLLGDSVGDFADIYPDLDYPIAYAIATGAFLLVLAVERVVPRVSKLEVESGGDPEADAFVDATATSAATPYLLLTTLSIHSLIAGVALGTDEEQSSFLVLLIAILAHKGSAGFALGTTFQRAGVAIRRALPALLFFACSTSVGVVLGLFADIAFDAGSMHVVTAWFKAIAAGTFLYIATLDIVREEFFPVETDRHGRYVCAFIGAGVMALVAIWM
ncbi:MAG: ZIP family metal transporter [Phycisphaera sp. TMED9]|nr:MAG: ZIP family metal transporter [Phycisphaera sp. TMED9]